MKYSKTSTKRPASPFRRRRITWTLVALTSIFVVYLYTSGSVFWSLPSSLKDLGFSHSSSKASKVAEAKAKDAALAETSRRVKVQEIHGLLHFVTAHADRRLNELDGSINVASVGLVKVDPEKTVDLRVFSPDGDDDWEQHMRALKNDHPLIVFSKSYCPYSRRAKALLESYQLQPEPTIVELDTRTDGPIIQGILGRLTGRSTVPNIILQGETIGGSDDIHLLAEEHKLKTLLRDGGLKIQAEV